MRRLSSALARRCLAPSVAAVAAASLVGAASAPAPVSPGRRPAVTARLAAGSPLAFASRAAVAGTPLAEDSLTAISCPAASRCVAAGSGPQSIGGALASWDGSAWHPLTPAVPATSSMAGLTFSSVRCAAVNRCVAVGRSLAKPGRQGVLALAEAWDGHRWRLLNTRSPSGDDSLRGVSCVSATDCVAVGGDRGFGGSHLALAEVWHGRRWATMGIPTPAGTDFGTWLNSVSCLGRSWCLAVGVYDNTKHAGSTLAELWNGRTWHLLTAPGAGFTSLSCVSRTDCLALGGRTVWRWNGATWMELTAQPGPAGASFASLSCRSANDCVAVGGTGTVPLAEFWNGTRWRPTPVASPQPGASLFAAACPRARECLAVGQASSGDFALPLAMAARWNGVSWRVSRLANLDSLSAVSCQRITACVAVGGFLDQAGRQVALAEHGHRGGLVPLPAPPNPPLSGSGIGDLGGLACARVTRCMAIDGQLGDLWTGTSWRVTTLPAAASGVACPAASSCLAVGGGSAEAWNGASWQALAPAIPRNSSATLLSGVSCVNPHWCMAVGEYFTDPHDSFGINLAEVWNGQSWRVLTVPEPGQNNQLTAVACTSTVNCVVVGGANNQTDTFHSFAGRWNGTSWRMFSVAGPDRFLVSVSCAAAAQCVAAGFVTLRPNTSAEINQPISQRWRGGTWQPVAAGGPGAALSSVSCVHPNACVAVGGRDDGRVLAVRYDGTRWSPVPAASP